MGLDGKETLLTNGAYDVIRISAIDAKTNMIYFLASPNNATQRYLYNISLTGAGDPELISPDTMKGTHAYNISPGALFASHNFSNSKNQRVSQWISLPAHQSIKVNSQPAALQSADLLPVEMFQVTTDDNVTMDGWMIKPTNFDSTKKYPIIFSVYGEPAGTMVNDAAGSAGTPLYSGNISADGYIQISVEGRGTPAPKGAAWRKAIYRKIGILNIRDQAMAAKKIMKWTFVDTSRIAVHGWSGGGSTTLNLLFQYPEIYKTGIAIAPVANQLCYDNIYQERYMGLPQENMEDYKNGSPVSHAKSQG